jgi:tetratricopeptide (TPR) repeat protein
MGDMIMIRAAHYALLIAMVLGLSNSCSAGPNGQANKLFVEAQQLLEKAERQKLAEKIPTLREAEDRLKSIVSQYPSANLAIQLASGQSVGTVSLQNVSDAITTAERDACFEAPTKACILQQAVRNAEAAKDGASLVEAAGMRVIFTPLTFYARLAQAQASAGMSQAANQSADKVLEIYSAVTSNGLFSVLPALASAGRTREALQLLDAATDTQRGPTAVQLREYLLLALARGQYAAGKKADAEATTKQALQTTWSSNDVRILAYLATMLAKLGLDKEASATIDQAAQAAASITPSNADFHNARFTTLVSLAEAQATLGRTIEAKTVLAKLLEQVRREPNYRDLDLFQLFNGNASIAALMDVKELAESTSNDQLKAAVLCAGAIGRANAGNISEAQTVMYLIKRDYSKVLALSAIAQAQAKAKLQSQANGTIEYALRTIKSLPDPAERAEALLAIAEAAAN